MLFRFEQVIPHFREPDGKPVWAREERVAPHTRAELAALKGKPSPTMVRMDGHGMVDWSTAHVPELLAESVGNGDGRVPSETEAATT